MRIFSFLCCVIVLSSCARLPFQQWNNQLEDLENELISQKKLSQEVAGPDVFLYKGAYNASKNKNAAPYPELKKVGDALESESNFILDKTEISLEKIAQFRSQYNEQTLKNIGPEWDDYSRLLADLNKQTEVNKVKLAEIKSKDVVFDSICISNKIKSTPLLEYEVELASKIAKMEDDFTHLKNEYSRFKREITSRENREESLRALNKMKQKERRIESENLQLSNLYSRLNSLRSDAMIFEGPFIDQTPELKLMDEKSRLVEDLIRQFSILVEDYE